MLTPLALLFPDIFIVLSVAKALQAWNRAEGSNSARGRKWALSERSEGISAAAKAALSVAGRYKSNG
jgi:hypothetical protein